MADEADQEEVVIQAQRQSLAPQLGIGSPGGPPVVRGTRRQIQAAISAGKLDELLVMPAAGVTTGEVGKGQTETVLTTALTEEQEKQLLADEAKAKKPAKKPATRKK